MGGYSFCLFFSSLFSDIQVKGILEFIQAQRDFLLICSFFHNAIRKNEIVTWS